MSEKSKIEWTDTTWNPVRGCVKVSAGCKNCYAERFAERFRGTPGHPYEQGFDLRLAPGMLTKPFAWTQSRLVFVNSMSDLFQDGVPDRYIEQVFEVMASADWHVYQILTKRPARMRDWVNKHRSSISSHIWLGVSVENQKVLPRIDILRETRAPVRFLSIEPLLESLGDVDFAGIHWVIAGGESGRGARPLKAEWVRSIRDKCARGNIPFFFKQWGGIHKKTAGCVLDGRTHDDYPEFSFRPIPTKADRVKMVKKF